MLKLIENAAFLYFQYFYYVCDLNNSTPRLMFNFLYLKITRLTQCFGVCF